MQLELRIRALNRLTKFVLSKAPIPLPTLDGIGPDRLIGRVKWNVVSIVPDPNLALPLGTIGARAEMTIGHVSVKEMDGNRAWTLTQSSATAWLMLSVRAKETARFDVSLLRIEVPGAVPQTFSPPLLVGSQELKGVAGGDETSQGAIILGSDVATVRISSASDPGLMAPPADRLNAAGAEGDWLIHIPGETFVTLASKEIRAALASLPKDIVVEDDLAVTWAAPPGSGWGVYGRVGLKKRDACPGVDVSVAVSIGLSVTAQTSPSPELRLDLVVGSRASNWDASRCLATSGLGLLGSAGFAIITEVILNSLEEVFGKLQIGGGFRKVDSGETWARFTRPGKLPEFLEPPSIAWVGSDGLTCSGPLRASLLVADFVGHRPRWKPLGYSLAGSWTVGFNCSLRQVNTSYITAPIQISDEVVEEIAGSRLEFVPVRVFATTTVLPQDRWFLELPGPRSLPELYAYITLTPFLADEVKRILSAIPARCLFIRALVYAALN